MYKHSFGIVTALAAYCWCPVAPAACLVNDANFSSADGGCKDLSSGIVWSPDMRGINGGYNAGYTSAYAQLDACDRWLNNHPNGGGHTDWRLPTLAEVQAALANGLNSHLDFFNNGGATLDDGAFRWTSCQAKQKGRFYSYVIRYTDGNFRLSTSGTAQVICVRGAPADLVNDCPSSSGKKNRSLSRTSLGALLMLPFALVVGACLLPGRRS